MPNTKQVIDRDINLLNSCADWLETRSEFHSFRNYSGLMREYAADLRALMEKLAPTAVEDPVTMDEIFGKKK